MAVGTFRPEIEIWSTDVIDAMEPDCVLGGLVDNKKRTLKPGSHRQAVMGLSWNREYRNVLASSSADTTVKLWDVTTQKCMMTLNFHKDKIPVVQFHPVEANVLLTASYDRVCAVTDGRSPNNGTWLGPSRRAPRGTPPTPTASTALPRRASCCASTSAAPTRPCCARRCTRALAPPSP